MHNYGFICIKTNKEWTDKLYFCKSYKNRLCSLEKRFIMIIDLSKGESCCARNSIERYKMEHPKVVANTNRWMFFFINREGIVWEKV